MRFPRNNGCRCGGTGVIFVMVGSWYRTCGPLWPTVTTPEEIVRWRTVRLISLQYQLGESYMYDEKIFIEVGILVV